jgi:GT2 family glycosyltransferase
MKPSLPSAPLTSLGHVPRFVTQVELSEPIVPQTAPPRYDGTRYVRGRVLVRLHGAPLGHVDLELTDSTLVAERVVTAVQAALGERIAAHLAADGLPPQRLTVRGLRSEAAPRCAAAGPHGHPGPPATVVICTRDRPASLAACLRSVLALSYPRFDVVVVDNAPRTDGGARVVRELADSRVRHVVEAVPGLSRARNRGVREASGAIVAFTDDDAVVDADWLSALAAGFTRAPGVECVTGVVVSAELDTDTHFLFDGSMSWGRNFGARVYDMHGNPGEWSLFPYTAGRLGTGANLALSRTALRDVGAFDEALGAGSPTRGGEDLDYLLRVMAAGLRLAYEPRALVWHVHGHGEENLGGQLFAYGSGLTAYALKHLLRPATAWDVGRRLVRGAMAPARAAEGGRTRSTVPGRLRIAELAGMLAGPYLYARARRRLREAT